MQPQKRNKLLDRMQAVLLVVLVFSAGFFFGSMNTLTEAQTRPALGDTEAAFDPLYEAFNALQSNYVDTLDVPTLVNGAIEGMAEAVGDPYTLYMDPQANEAFDNSLSGEYEGIGVVIRTIEETGEIEVVNPIDGSPALRAGVQPGDIFLSVDGENVVGLNQNELALRVRGPEGTDVQITFLRDDEEIQLTLTRARLEVPNIEWEVLEGEVGYVSLYRFSSPARDQLDEALAEIKVNELKGLIFDLRGNGGGLLRSAIEIGSAFIEDDVILYESLADGSEEVFRSTGDYADINVPIVVLVDEASASASELIAGALQDLEVATLIGEPTFGKGTVQTVQLLSNGGSIRITIARWLTPDRNWIDQDGVTPDIIIEWDPETAEEREGDDPQLEAALDFLSELE